MVSIMQPPPPQSSSSKSDLDTTPVTDDGDAAINIQMSQHAFLMSAAGLTARRHQQRSAAARAAAAVPGELPDYIKKAWGVTPSRLTDSLPSVMALFYCVLDLRLTMGDGFIASMARARSGMRGDVWNTANIVPKPRAPKLGMLNYSAMAAAAVNPMHPNAFSDGCIPDMKLTTYATRFFEVAPVQARLSPAVYILVLIYLDRAFQRNSGMFMNSFNAHRMVLGAFIVAVKYHEDEYISQHVFAANGGVSMDEINHLEVEFLRAIDHRCFVTHQEFERAEVDLMMECLEHNPTSRIIGVMRQNDIYGIDIAIDQVASGRIGSKFNQAEKNLIVRENTKALLGRMFPGMPIDASTVNPTPKQWKMWSILADKMTTEQHYIYQMLLNIVIEFDQVSRPATLESRVYANGNGYSTSHHTGNGHGNANQHQHTRRTAINGDGYRTGQVHGHGNAMESGVSDGCRTATMNSSVNNGRMNVYINPGAEYDATVSYVTTSTATSGYERNPQREDTSSSKTQWPKVMNGMSLPPVKSVAKQTRNGNGHIGGHLGNNGQKQHAHNHHAHAVDPWGQVHNTHQQKQGYGSYTHYRTHDTVDHSTSIAKSAVSFILNDIDPFADLSYQAHYDFNHNISRHHQNHRTAAAPAQQCSGQSLLMQW